jgi:hypothetical protein
MIPEGYMVCKFTLKSGSEVKTLQQTINLQLVHAGSAAPVAGDFPATPNDVGAVTKTVLLANAEKANSLIIEGYSDSISNKSDLDLVVVIGAKALEDFFEKNVISRCQSLQTEGTVYKKVEISLYYSKLVSGVSGRGNFASLRQYENHKLSVPPTVCGSIDGGRPAAIGAISINQYPGRASERLTAKAATRAIDKPGRFLVRGCAVNTGEALRGSQVTALSGFLQDGAALTVSSNWSLIPVVDVIGDLWRVRAAQSAGYVRVAAQRAQSPSKAAGEGPGA